MTGSPETLLSLYDAAIASADPAAATAAAIQSLEIPRERRVLLFAMGKAAHSMASASVATLLRSLHHIAGGVVVTPEGGRSPYPTLQAVQGNHPVPGADSFAAAEKIHEVAKGRRASDVAIVLVSGGASSLIAAPLRGHVNADLVALYEMLLGSGLDIGAMNSVRKRFSRWGGGRLALALAPAATHCLAVSDVPGDEVQSIGSGPCAPDDKTSAEVTAILEGVGLLSQISPAYREYLTSVTRGITGETPKTGHPAFAHVTTQVVVTNRVALEGAAAAAAERGMRVEVVENPLAGSAVRAGEEMAKKLLAARQTRNGSPKCVIWGGETTVASSGSASGVAGGGRCQEMVLAAARVLADAGERAAGIRLLAAGTDGRDGVTDAAGACVDATTWAAIRATGADPVSALAKHESNRALASVNALIPRRRTGTNVMDVAIGIVD